MTIAIISPLLLYVNTANLIIIIFSPTEQGDGMNEKQKEKKSRNLLFKFTYSALAY